MIRAVSQDAVHVSFGHPASSFVDFAPDVPEASAQTPHYSFWKETNEPDSGAQPEIGQVVLHGIER